mgnify:CR=1 FL=1
MPTYTKLEPIPVTEDGYDLYVEGVSDDGVPFSGLERSPELLAAVNAEETP